MDPNIKIPKRIAKLPIDARGYPVPFFVAKDDRGEWDFRMVDADKMRNAVRSRLCWICGEPLGRYLAFTIGPMCMVNRTSGEPPSHRECAQFSCQVCPFLTNPDQKRNPRKVYGTTSLPGGEMIKRNPGAALVWVCEEYQVHMDNRTHGWIFKIGEPLDIEFWSEGRKATRDEVEASIESGLPLLEEMARTEGQKALDALGKSKEKAYELMRTYGHNLQAA